MYLDDIYLDGLLATIYNILIDVKVHGLLFFFSYLPKSS